MKVEAGCLFPRAEGRAVTVPFEDRVGLAATELEAARRTLGI